MHKIKRMIRKLSKSSKFSASLYKKLSRIKMKCCKRIDDKTYIELKYKGNLGEKLNIDNPQTICEKIQWLKLFDRKPIYSVMADKYHSKEFVAERVGSKYVVPAYGQWSNFDEIDFDILPEQFVLKCNHDCGSVVICKDKQHFNKKNAKKILSPALKINYFYFSREWSYKNITPLIFAEKYLGDHKNNELVDYKIYCFNGEPKIIHIASDREANGVKATFYDLEWNRLPFKFRDYEDDSREFQKPKKLAEMIEIARELSKDTLFLRVDLFLIEENIYVGELTFYSVAGLQPLEPREWESIIGSWLSLPIEE